MAIEPATGPLVRVRDLRVSFRLDKETLFEAVKGISFDIPRNSTVALVGESGSGKSVTSLALLGLLPPENTIIHPGSRVEFDGRELLGLSRAELRDMRGADISMIFQEPMTSLNPVFTVGFQLEEVLKLHMGLTGSKARKRALELLDEVGIPDPARRINAFPSQMSGGQQQRVMIAMAIACEPKLLIADEPTTALDVTVQRQIVEEAPVGELFKEPLHPYTQGLLRSIPRIDLAATKRQKLEPIGGTVPTLRGPEKPGCRFAPRCGQAKPMHFENTPPLKEVRPGHKVACFLY